MLQWRSHRATNEEGACRATSHGRFAGDEKHQHETGLRGWGGRTSTLADRYGFALLLPEQQPSNNPNGCFNWFLPGDTRRGGGEALSIRQMIEKIVIDKNIDRRRIFITGLPAGGAMTSAMLVSYPEVFAGGAIIAGLPYGAASNAQQAFESMFQSPPRSAREWGDLLRYCANRVRGC
jgi:poly(hydroxyalkanoate) depolymerase family esterase